MHSRAPLKPKVAPPAPAPLHLKASAPHTQHVKPLVIPSITWSSAPPPIAPRSFSTPPPPPPSPDLATEPPPSASANVDAAAAAAFELQQQRARAEGLGRALEVRDEARALLLQTLEESLAPLHYAVRDLERRLLALEQRAPIAAQPPPPAAPAPPAAASSARSFAILPPATVVARAASDPYGAVAAVPQAVVAPPPPRGPIEIDVRFDGTRRKRRVVALFALFILLVFGSLGGAAIMSWMEPR